MNDEPPQNVVQAATKVANALITALPPAFVSLVALNVIFLALTFWFLTTQSEQRVTKVINSCCVLQQLLFAIDPATFSGRDPGAFRQWLEDFRACHGTE